MNNSILKQLFISYAAIFLFLLVSLAMISYVELSTYLNNSISRDIHSSLKLQRKQLESILNNQQNNIKSWSKLHVMDDLITDDADLIITQTLESIKKQYQLPGHLYAFSKNWSLISSDQKITSDPKEFSIWKKAIGENVSVIGKHTDPITHKNIIALWQPVYASFNKNLIIGYLVLTYPWQYVEQLSRTGRPHMHVLLFDENGRNITESKNIPFPTLQSLTNYESNQQWLTLFSISKKLYDKNKLLEHNYREINVNNESFFLHHLKESNTMPLTNLWHWYSLTNKTALYTPLKHALKIGLLFVFIALIIILSIILVISRKISKPIEMLTKTAVDITRTLDLTKRVPVYGHNEISRLAASFNYMCINLEKVWQEKNKVTDELQASNQHLESKIAERTKHLAWQATHDTLTKLPNRELLSERLNHAISRADRDSLILAIMFIDLDGFKAINDNFGHNQGDFLLTELAHRFMSIIREPDTIARIGGDEFVILMQIKSPKDLDSPLVRITDLINAPIKSKGESLSVSSSIGVTFYPDDCSDSDGLIRHADQAMYKAKQKGRNQIQFFNVEMEHQIHSRYKQKKGIIHALKNDEFILYFQPQVNLQTGTVIGAEALLRWQHPEHGVLSPNDFLPTVEQTVLIIDIGEWVIQQACWQLQQWNQQGLELKLSINIASQHIQRPDFLERLLATLGSYPGVNATQLILEITEHSSMEDIDKVKCIIQKCSEHNIEIALDDFGTGFSSFTHLRHLPVSTLKIDKSFVIGMLKNIGDNAIVESTIQLANIFKKNVVAEGIETMQHYNQLKTLNCTFGQGYIISKPLPNDQFLAWLENYS
ncbi:MAG: EAL domain-containing protein [Pseudomonadota bacterium]